MNMNVTPLYYNFPRFGFDVGALSNLLALQSYQEQPITCQIPLVDGLYNSTVGTMGINYFPNFFPVTEPLKKQQPYFQPQELVSTQSDVETTAKTEKSAEEISYSKHCLRFCRKLSKVMLEQIKSNSWLYNGLLTFCAEASNAVFFSYQLPKVDSIEYSELITKFLDEIWNKFRAQMSYSYNKGICIVKSDYWASVFDRSTLTKNFQEFALAQGKLKLEEHQSINYELIFQKEGAASSLGRILHSCCIILVLAAIMKDDGPKAKYLSSLGKSDNFITLVIKPSLFKNYNHRSGKFALECCGKCKICRSKLLGPDYLKELDRARKTKDSIKNFIEFTLPKRGPMTTEQVSSLYNMAVNSL